MTFAIATTSVILLVAIILLVTEKLPVDLTALAVMTVLMVLGILTPRESLAGFANPAPLTVAVLFVVSRALIRTGALVFITDFVIKLSRGNPKRLLFLSLFLVGGFSSFLNNTPVVVLFISIIMAVCCEYSLSPSKFLMPISFISILAGTSTLIGTSTNIIVSDLAAQSGMEPLAMFELSVLGMPMAMAGAVFLFFLSPRVLGDHKAPVCETRGGDRNKYISELLVPRSSPLIGRPALRAFEERFPNIELYEVVRELQIIDPGPQSAEIQEGDVLLVKATAQQLAQILDEKCALLRDGESGIVTKPHDQKSVLAELLVPPNSDSVGRSIGSLLAELDAHIKVIGIKRHWKHYPAEQVSTLRLTVGDVILVQTPVDHLEQIRSSGNLLVIEDVHKTIVNRKKAPLAMGIFLLMILATTIGISDILVSSMSAMMLMLLTRCISIREAYKAIEGRVLILIIGTLALGVALTKTGAASYYAEIMLLPLQGTSPGLVLSAFILLTSVLSLFISNNTTAVLLLPIAVSTASALGVDPRPFVIGICMGASACYATPIGYQTNLLVYGPGGYRFKDYLKLGAPLNIAVWIISSIAIPFIWPF